MTPTVHFITLEDEQGLLDVIVRPEVYERYRRVLHRSRLLAVEGLVQHRDGVINVVAERVAEL